MISTKWIEFPENDELLAEVRKIREEVFVVEQGTPAELEFDALDGRAVHLLVYENQKPVATGRIIFEGKDCFLGRIAVLKEKRGEGYGDLVVRALIRRAYNSGAEKQFVRAQARVKGFYEGLGFKQISEPFMHDGILHIKMEHYGDIGGKC